MSVTKDLFEFRASEQEFRAAKNIFPGGVQASRQLLLSGQSPIYIDRAEGSHTWDIDGNEYMWNQGTKLMDGLGELAAESRVPVRFTGYPPPNAPPAVCL